ncbi:heme exporter protein CcmD [Ciceribacter thiooxidans]|uniref:Heme exporter protein D n=1 Tax=Ciceribacter thiooxidans TaxID=1969821 RepID=A0ABV7HTM0_9HYPH|nr:heme exporter protein CcmD [Ciceribacter thiooxidans]
MSHEFYIYVSYGVTGIVILALIGWVWLDGRARQRELKELEAAGVRRRSATVAGDRQA